MPVIYLMRRHGVIFLMHVVSDNKFIPHGKSLRVGMLLDELCAWEIQCH